MSEQIRSNRLLQNANRRAIIEECKKALVGVPSSNEVNRLLTLFMAANGFTRSEIVENLGVTRKTVSNVMARYRLAGILGMANNYVRSRLTEKVKDRLTKLISEHNPRDCGYNGDAWTGQMVRQHLENVEGITLSVASVYRVLLDLGIVLSKDPDACYFYDRIESAGVKQTSVENESDLLDFVNRPKA